MSISSQAVTYGLPKPKQVKRVYQQTVASKVDSYTWQYGSIIMITAATILIIGYLLYIFLV